MKLSLCMVKSGTLKHNLSKFGSILKTFLKNDFIESGLDPPRKVERSDFPRGVLGGGAPLVKLL